MKTLFDSLMALLAPVTPPAAALSIPVNVARTRYFRHRTCRSMIAFYDDDGRGMTMESSRWHFPDGTRPAAYSSDKPVCPDCGKQVWLVARMVVEIV